MDERAYRIPEPRKDSLTVAVCPNPSCSSVSHLSCLSSAFLTTTPSISAHYPSLVPRGGSCPSCGEYILWGDVVRGCYRRRSQGATVLAEDEDDASSLASNNDISTGPSKKGSPTTTKLKRGRPRKQMQKLPITESSFAHRKSTKPVQSILPKKQASLNPAVRAPKQTVSQAHRPAKRAAGKSKCKIPLQVRLICLSLSSDNH